MPQTYVAIDLETTGLDAQRDAIIEIGCVKFQGDEIVDQWSSLANPGRPVPFQITQLTGITSRDVAGAPPVGQLLPAIRRFVGPAPIVAHNAGFDLGFLQAAGLSFANPTLDTFELAGVVLPTASGYSLGALAGHFGIQLTSAHRALADARATALLFAALQAHAARLPLATLIEINRLAGSSNWPLRDIFIQAEREATRTVFLKPYQRQALQEGDLGPLLHPLAVQGDDIPEELEPLEQPLPLDVDLLAAILEPDGPMAESFPGYEDRPPQVEMLRTVARAFNNADHLLIEAGTGTGKSLAYLLPAIAWAVQNRRRVVISTNTINLQDQLVTKDLPDLQKVFEDLLAAPPDGDSRFRQFAEQTRGLRVTLMKGRANYLCPRRLDAMRSRQDLTHDELRVLARVLVWVAGTTTGDRGELFLAGGRDFGIWSRLATESGTCTADRCLRSQAGRCFFYRNRRQAEAAHLIIVNHALLLSDVAVANRVLPPFRHLIVDEAHHLEEATTNQLSFEATEEGLGRLLDGIDGGDGGLLSDLRKRSQAGLPTAVRQALEGEMFQVQRQADLCRDRLRDFFEALGAFLETGKPNQSPYNLQVRLDSRVRSQPAWSEVEIAWDQAGTPLYDLYRGLDRLAKGLGELEQAGVQGLDDLLADLNNASGQFAEAYEQLHAAIIDPDAQGIYWAEVAAGNGRLSVHVAPLHVGPLVEEHLFHQKDNVILTSATLRTAGSYEYLQERLHAYEARTATVGSPFDYKGSTLVYVPTDLADPNSPNFQSQVDQAVASLARALGGRTLALFTSYSQLRRTAEAIGPGLAAAGIDLYQQGSGGSRQQLLENFRADGRSVLLGTRSFWEGVDVVGEALSGLLLARLPFAVPSDPIVAARAETFENAFYQYSVPDAILRFRQGFGRLIRSQQDRGVCVIMDNRVLTRRYGQLFLESLPDCTVRRGPLVQMPQAAQDWLARE